MNLFKTMVSTLASIMQIALILVGYSDQIRTIVQTGSVEALSPVLFILAVVTHSLWLLHGIFKKDYYIFAPQIPGTILSLVIVIMIIVV